MEQLFEENFVQELNRIVDGYGIDHSQICLELTERAMTDDFAKAKTYMERVTSLGYRFFLDDFGTGMSNFNCLLDLPFKNVKLDMCLTATIVTDTTQQTLVSTLTELFHKMDAFVIAEGAETEQQVELLAKYGIDRIQGYYFARPMRLDSLLDFYKKNPLEAEQI
jgi:EAL domain-containing protein (putative c-di-GMP-specific phosphodiesterase class I)